MLNTGSIVRAVTRSGVSGRGQQGLNDLVAQNQPGCEGLQTVWEHLVALAAAEALNHLFARLADLALNWYLRFLFLRSALSSP